MYITGHVHIHMCIIQRLNNSLVDVKKETTIRQFVNEKLIIYSNAYN